MTIFDQRGQKVIYQYNAAGNINFEAVHDIADLTTELHKLQNEVQRAAQAGVLDAEVAADAEAKIKKAAIQVQAPTSDRKTTLVYLQEAKTLIQGIAAEAGLVGGLAQAAEIVKRLLQ